MSAPPVRPHQWSRDEYERMVAAGVLPPGARLQLMDGEVLEMPPQGSGHATGVQLVEEALRRAFARGHVVRVQMPLALDERSVPEPDVAVVAGDPRDFRDAHPETAGLVVEVADATPELDRGPKRALYARAGISEYWVLDLVEHRLEVHREPEAGVYALTRVLLAGQAVTAPSDPPLEIPIDDLLP